MADHALQILPSHYKTDNFSKVARQLRSLTHHRKKAIASRKHVKGFGRGAGLFRVNTHRMQRVIVKVAYAKNTQTRSWAAHGKYLQRENAKEQGKKSMGFNAINSVINLQSTLQEWQEAGDKHFFKIILAPDQGHKLELISYSRTFMEQIQRDLGTSIQWMAIDHNNTDHTHVHLLIRGVDSKENPLILDPLYIAEGFRARSQELATKILGLRTQKDRELTRQKQIESPRLTEIDRNLRFRAKENVVSYANPVPQLGSARTRRLHEIARLKYLESVGLVTQFAKKKWRLHDDLETALRAMQLSGDIIKSRAKHKLTSEILLNPFSPTLVTENNPLLGRVVGFGLENELYDSRYLLLQDLQDKVHYIRATSGIIKARDARQFCNQDVISLQESFFISKEGKKVSFIKVTNYKCMQGLLNSPNPIFDDYILSFIKSQTTSSDCLDFKSLFTNEPLKAINQRIGEFITAQVLINENNKLTLSEDYCSKLVDLQHARLGPTIYLNTNTVSIPLVGEVIASHETKLLIRDISGLHYQVFTKDLGNIKPILVSQCVHLQVNPDLHHSPNKTPPIICKVLKKSSYHPDPLNLTLTKLDHLIAAVGLPVSSEQSWLAENMRDQVKLWESRGIVATKSNDFIAHAQRWLEKESTLEKIQTRYSIPLVIVEDTTRHNYQGKVVGLGSVDKTGKTYLVIKNDNRLEALQLSAEQLRHCSLKRDLTIILPDQYLNKDHSWVRKHQFTRTRKLKKDY